MPRRRRYTVLTRSNDTGGEYYKLQVVIREGADGFATGGPLTRLRVCVCVRGQHRGCGLVVGMRCQRMHACVAHHAHCVQSAWAQVPSTAPAKPRPPRRRWRWSTSIACFFPALRATQLPLSLRPDPARLCNRVAGKPGSMPPQRALVQAKAFTVVQGVLGYSVNGTQGSASAGQSVVIPAGEQPVVWRRSREKSALGALRGWEKQRAPAGLAPSGVTAVISRSPRALAREMGRGARTRTGRGSQAGAGGSERSR